MMTIRDFLYLVNTGKRNRDRKELARQWLVGVSVVTAAASLGVGTGVLFAPKAGKETRADLKKKAIKTADAIENAVLDKADTAMASVADNAQGAADTLKDASTKVNSAKKDA